jgi:F-type H+-transporting ATPase subunit gamma
MANSRVIKNRIKTVKNTGKITKTMAMVSTAKSTKVIGLIKASRPYAARLSSFAKALSRSCEDHPLFLENPKAERRLLIVLTANRGLCGGFNANLIRLARENADVNTDVWMYGKKGISAFRFSKLDMAKTSAEVQDIPTFDVASELSDQLMEAYESGLYKDVRVIYSEFVSAGQQIPKVETILPMTAESDDNDSDGAQDEGFEPIYHPDKDGLIADLIPRLMRVKTYRITLDSSASEHLARQMAMNSASDNAKDMAKSLTLSYNRARQAQITTEISEIVGGAEALN